MDRPRDRTDAGLEEEQKHQKTAQNSPREKGTLGNIISTGTDHKMGEHRADLAKHQQLSTANAIDEEQRKHCGKAGDHLGEEILVF